MLTTSMNIGVSRLCIHRKISVAVFTGLSVIMKTFTAVYRTPS